MSKIKSTLVAKQQRTKKSITHDNAQDKPAMPRKYEPGRWHVAYLGVAFGFGHTYLDSALREIEHVPNRHLFTIVAPNGARLSYEAAQLL